jgi:transcriptional regulator with XRE-family HTH domain
MTVISRKFADELTEKEMRDAYLEEQTRTKLAQQIRVLRVQRDWSQSELGQILDKPQSNIARLEDREIARYTLSTLFELASAFDVGLVVEFVSYDDFLRRTHDLSPQHLQVSSFTRTMIEPLCYDAAGVTANNLFQIDFAGNVSSTNLSCTSFNFLVPFSNLNVYQTGADTFVIRSSVAEEETAHVEYGDEAAAARQFMPLVAPPEINQLGVSPGKIPVYRPKLGGQPIGLGLGI